MVGSVTAVLWVYETANATGWLFIWWTGGHSSISSLQTLILILSSAALDLAIVDFMYCFTISGILTGLLISLSFSACKDSLCIIGFVFCYFDLCFWVLLCRLSSSICWWWSQLLISISSNQLVGSVLSGRWWWASVVSLFFGDCGLWIEFWIISIL